ncbi:hypothetical protein NQ318_003443 [Aromia moschata]|uniref:VWFD domain-containing protein n=1 Tax=Aromia moschata TaxID=1265417 RepID=A0AAV8YW16_9CUCU|nr:hypothetical protein NQ318_003443 [Aromia moschata]
MKWRRSESRKQYLQDDPLYQQCQREMRGGDYQLPACANATMTANLLNQANVNIHYKKMKPDVVEAVEAIYNAFQVNYYPSLQFKNKGTGKEKEINLQYELDPDLRFVNCTVVTSNEENNFGEWGRTLFATHPVFHVRSRVMSTIFGLQTYRPICVVDKAHISTFSNRTYPASLDKHWTVALQYIPQDARHYEEPKSVQEQLRTQPENFVVFVRQSGQGRDVKITFSSPETDYKLMDITMSSGQGSSGMKTKVNVNGQEVQVSGHSSHDIGEGYVQIYGLPNGEVKVEVRDWFYVISDGERMKLTALNGRFRNSVRGLCGVFNDDEANDFLTPGNCIVGDYKQFIKSYDIESGEGRGQTQTHSKGSHECVPKEVPLYADVISNRLWSQRSQHSGDCTLLQTRYVEEYGQICFTIGEMPVCRGHCRQRGTITNNVPVHCVKNSNAAQLWKKQIDQGQSPDFGHKKETKITRIELPQSCVP